MFDGRKFFDGVRCVRVVVCMCVVFFQFFFYEGRFGGILGVFCMKGALMAGRFLTACVVCEWVVVFIIFLIQR
jgi:hypothetical protein